MARGNPVVRVPGMRVELGPNRRWAIAVLLGAAILALTVILITRDPVASAVGAVAIGGIAVALVIGRWLGLRHARSTADRSWDALRAAAGRPRPGTGAVSLWFYPGFDPNPYTTLLYQELPTQGLDAVPMATLDELHDIPSGGLFHYHWTERLQGGVRRHSEAEARVERQLAAFAALKDRGVGLIWSVHEVLPHECPYPDVEQRYRQQLAAMADLIHVLHPATIDEVAPLYSLDPAKVVTVEHPLYTGAVPDHVSRAAARQALGVDDAETLLLGFGALRAYKGFDRLLRAVPDLQRHTAGHGVRTLVVGRPDPNHESWRHDDVLADLARGLPRTEVVAASVPDHLVQYVFRAADLLVLPYRRGLNSGALFLGLTFGVPLVAARNGVTAELASHVPIHLFDRDSDEDLLRALVSAVQEGRRRASLDEAFILEHLPREVSRRFGGALRERFPQRFSEVADSRGS